MSPSKYGIDQDFSKSINIFKRSYESEIKSINIQPIATGNEYTTESDNIFRVAYDPSRYFQILIQHRGERCELDRSHMRTYFLNWKTSKLMVTREKGVVVQNERAFHHGSSFFHAGCGHCDVFCRLC